MSQMTLRQFSAPSNSHIPTRLTNDQGTDDFEIKTGLVNMIQASPFCGKASEDANAHLQNFLEVSSIINPKGTLMDNIRLRLFPFSLVGKAKMWFYAYKEEFDTWDACANAFLVKYFPVGKTNTLRNRITSFQQLQDETVQEAWERLQEYIAVGPHHDMEEWLVIQKFFHGLNRRSQDHMDAAAGGAFHSLDVAGARVLINKVASNQSWNEERQPAHAKGVHEIDSVDRLVAKMDLLMKKLESPHQEVTQTESRMTCEKCGNTGHSGKSCPFTQEDENFIGNNTPYDTDCRLQQGWNFKPDLPFGQQQGNNFNNSFQPSLKDFMKGQKQINDNISEKFLANDKILESLAMQLDGFNSVIKNQLSFNKLIETKVTLLASSYLNQNTGKLSGKPEVNPKESVNVVAVRARQSTQRPHLPQDVGAQRKTVTARNTKAKDGVLEEAEESNTIATQEDPVEPHRTSRDCHDTTALLFLERKRRPVADKQFSKFVEVIKKLYGNIPLLDTMQVPTYAEYLKDILGNKRVLPPTEVMQLTEECSPAILNPLLEKKKKPRCRTITCSIGAQHFKHALFDL
ncbi:uncharacterized protein LOC120645669 [Panicum virgatum]|uniref:uncharacterized protein LOC120645669 n=1 Tax=Panicum virgatum TaxID=38727 RepID=UPI0019D5AF11|nr:uncharacterized protein LOC120645669 [Panicum virgatum]